MPRRTYNPAFTFLFLLTLLPGANVLGAQRSAWYDQQQVDAGKLLFRQHCAGCHGQHAESTPNWKQTDANGIYPPPPLNGSAHAWHHDLPLLRKTVREGGLALGGQMPPFARILNAQQIDAVIAFFQSLWPDETYARWAENFDITSRPPAAAGEITTSDSLPDTRFLRQRLGADQAIGKARPTPIPGIYQIRFGNQILYLSADGEFAFIGDMIDLKKGINLTKRKAK